MYIIISTNYHNKNIFIPQTCTTALQNSNEFKNICSSGVDAMSFCVIHDQSSVGEGILRGNDEYKPLKPVAKT